MSDRSLTSRDPDSVDRRPGSRGATERLAEFTVGWRLPPGPSAAAREATWVLIDLIGTALVGSVERCSEIVAGIARQDGASGPATVVGHGFRTVPSYAALANATSGHALDFDDSGLTSGAGHPSVAVVPAALAVAEQMGSSGRQLLEGIIVGYEVMSRVGRCGGGTDGESHTRGFHGTGVNGVFGASAAAARLVGLDVERTRIAFGIAASRSAGLRANSGTMTKPLHAGQACRSGIESVVLASHGFTASDTIVETRAGWTDAFAGGRYVREDLTEGLGESLAIEQGGNFKLFPSAGENHGAIHAVLELMATNGLRPDEIAEIDVTMQDVAANVTLLYPWPSTGLEGKFSLAYNVAAAWADGAVGIDTFDDGKLPELEPYRSRIRVRGVPGRPPFQVTARTVDGRELHAEQPFSRRHQPGGRISPERDALLVAKFAANVAATRSSHHADELLEVLRGIDQQPTLTILTELVL